jgi:hypothetical protein
MKPGCTTRSNANGSQIRLMEVVCIQIQCTIITARSEAGSDGGRWIELAQDHVQWRALVLTVLNLQVLLPESYLISKMDLREVGSEDVRPNQ